ncbi:MAG TPA: LCP family protein [Gaiellaceae bacterium]
MGRVATGNGNGNGRAVLPPRALEPIRRYRQPPPGRPSTGRLIGKVFGWIALALLVVGSGLAGGLYLYGHETLSALAPHSKSVKAAAGYLTQVPPPSQPATALLIGYDARRGIDGFGASGSRSDTIMLIRADPQLNTLSMMSFPRDLVVPIYCKDTTSAITTDRINTAFTSCGPVGTLNTVEKLAGIPINYLITVDFHGFKLLVNKLHGVYLNVDHRYYIAPNTGTATINLEPGYQKLNGQQALDFVRFRHTDSDLYRVARQQLFVEALKDRLASGFSLFDIPKLISAVKGSVEIGQGGCPDCAPSLSEIESYAGLAFKLPPGHLFRDTIENLQPYGVANAELVAATSDVQAAVNEFQHPDVTLAQRSNAVALGRKPKAPKQPVLQAGQVSTLVLNGTSILGLARDTSYKLALAGYHTVQLPPTVLADAPSQGYYSNYVYYDSVQPNARQAADELKATFGAHTLVAPLPPEIASLSQQAGNPLTVVVVGTSFSGELESPQAHVVQVAPHVPPDVRADPGLTLAALQAVRSKVGFRILQPTEIEHSSTLAASDSVRVFRAAPHTHELAMTFVTGAGNVYWNVIETSWANPPILRHATSHVRLQGRSFDLYTTGGDITMVVLHEGGTSYWVVNSVLNDLSNETMLAIAKGLQPMGK